MLIYGVIQKRHNKIKLFQYTVLPLKNVNDKTGTVWS